MGNTIKKAFAATRLAGAFGAAKNKKKVLPEATVVAAFPGVSAGGVAPTPSGWGGLLTGQQAARQFSSARMTAGAAPGGAVAVNIQQFSDTSSAQQQPAGNRFCMGCGTAFENAQTRFCGSCGMRRQAAGPGHLRALAGQHESGRSLVARLKEEEEAAHRELQDHADAERERMQRLVMERRSRGPRKKR